MPPNDPMAGREARALHVLNRLAFGPGPGDLAHVMQIGVNAYIEEQLHPERIPLPPGLEARLALLPTLGLTPSALLAEYGPPLRIPGEPRDLAAVKAQRRRSRVILEQAIAARLLRAVDSPRQLQQVMVDFWYNHFNVFAGKGLDHLWIGAYEEEAIRPYALGHFRDLLLATARHPAMLFYLDNWQNVAPGSGGPRARLKGINENYAREVMELHTLGVNGGYTQADVISLAHILTGWGLAPRRQAYRQTMAGAPLFRFYPRRHDGSPELFLGREMSGQGMAEGEAALDRLARSPATAQHIAFELAQYFVADRPSPALVERLANRFLATDGDIRAVLETLFHSPEFWARGAMNSKFKTPYRFVVSAVRASGRRLENVRPLAGTLRLLGEPLYGCETPDGYKNTESAWLDAGAMTERLSFAAALGAGGLPIDRPAPDRPASDRMRPAAARMQAGMSPSGNMDMAPHPRPVPVTLASLEATLGSLIRPKTLAVALSEPRPLQAGLVLGSPEFMRY